MEFAGEVADVIDAEVNPVEYSRTLPASILMVVEKSWYPAFVILSTCVPGDNPEIIAGLIPFTSLSTETSAPVGVVDIESEPVESDDEPLFRNLQVAPDSAGLLVVCLLGYCLLDDWLGELSDG